MEDPFTIDVVFSLQCLNHNPKRLENKDRAQHSQAPGAEDNQKNIRNSMTPTSCTKTSRVYTKQGQTQQTWMNMALSQELLKQCRPSQESPTKLASRTRTSQDEVDVHTGKRRQSTNTISTLNQARISKHVSLRISSSHCSWRKISASDHHKTNSVPCMTVAPSTRLADTHGEPLLWTM